MHHKEVIHWCVSTAKGSTVYRYPDFVDLYAKLGLHHYNLLEVKKKKTIYSLFFALCITFNCFFLISSGYKLSIQ